MEHYKISKISKYSTVSKLVTKKWIKVNDLLSGQYSVNKNIRFNNSMLRSHLCNYSDVYIAVKGTIAVERDDDGEIINKKRIFKNNAPFHTYQKLITYL